MCVKVPFAKNHTLLVSFIHLSLGLFLWRAEKTLPYLLLRLTAAQKLRLSVTFPRQGLSAQAT